MIGAMKKQRAHTLIIRASCHIDTSQHALNSLDRLIKVRVSRVSTREDGKVTHAFGLARIFLKEVARKWLTEIGPTVGRRSPSSTEINGEHLRLAFHKHRNGSCTLRLFTGATPLVLRYIRRNHNGKATLS